MTTLAKNYTTQRAVTLANLVLTRRKDVRILTLEDGSEAGIELLAQFRSPTPGLPANPSFGVQVKGTSGPLNDERAANRFAKQVVRAVTPNQSAYALLAPMVLFVFSMEDDRGYWGWILKPTVDNEKGPSLQRVERMEMAEINADALDTLFESVSEWFSALGKVLDLR